MSEAEYAKRCGASQYARQRFEDVARADAVEERERTLSDVLDSLGIRHEPAAIEGKRAWYDSAGIHQGDYDAAEGWAELERRRRASRG